MEATFTGNLAHPFYGVQWGDHGGAIKDIRAVVARFPPTSPRAATATWT